MADTFIPAGGPQMTYTDDDGGTLSIGVKGEPEFGVPLVTISAEQFIIEDDAAFLAWLRKCLRAARKRWVEGV